MSTLSQLHDTSNPNGLLNQKYVNIVTRAAHWMAWFDLCKLNLA